MPDDVYWASNGAAELIYSTRPTFRKRKTKWEKRYGVPQALAIAATPMKMTVGQLLLLACGAASPGAGVGEQVPRQVLSSMAPSSSFSAKERSVLGTHRRWPLASDCCCCLRPPSALE